MCIVMIVLIHQSCFYHFIGGVSTPLPLMCACMGERNGSFQCCVLRTMMMAPNPGIQVLNTSIEQKRGTTFDSYTTPYCVRSMHEICLATLVVRFVQY